MRFTRTLSLVTLDLLLAAVAASGAFAETVQRDLRAQPGGRIVFDLESGGTIEVFGWDQSRVTVDADLGDLGAEEIDLAIEQKGSIISIRTSEVPRNRRTHSLRFHVMAPVDSSVSLETMGGGVTLSNLEGTFEGETMGGDLSLSELRGNVELSTMGGNVGLTGSSLDGAISTMGGNVNLKETAGSLTVKTMGGNLTFDTVSGGVKAETMGGNVSFTHGGGSGSAPEDVVRLSTMGGDIQVDEAPEGAELETMGGDITLGSAAVRVKATTMGGDIELGEVDGAVHASTMGGDVSVRIVERGGAQSRDVEISSQGGDITLVVPDGFSMDVDVEITWTRGFSEPPEIESDFPLSIETSDWVEGADDEHGHRGKHHRLVTAAGEHRGGRNKVTIRTVNGDVSIRRG